MIHRKTLRRARETALYIAAHPTRLRPVIVAHVMRRWGVTHKTGIRYVRIAEQISGVTTRTKL